jgi:hypothetical protein
MRCRNSGVYGGFDLGIVDSSFPERDLVSTKPGALQYGNKLQTQLDVSRGPGKGIVMCAKNDAIQLVLMVKLTNPAVGNKSELLAPIRDGSPVVVKIENISLDPQVSQHLEQADSDSFHQRCFP